MNKSKKRIAGGAIASALSIALILLLSQTSLFHSLEKKTLDYRFIIRDSIKKTPLDSPIIIVGIDGKALDKFSDPAALNEALMDSIVAISDSGAKAVGFDVIHLSAMDPDRCRYDENAFLKTILRSKHLIAPYYMMRDDVGMPIYVTNLMKRIMGLEQEEINSFPQAGKLKLLDAASNMLPVKFGYANLILDDDGVVRDIKLAENVGKSALPSFSMSVYLAYSGKKQEDIKMDGKSIRIDKKHIPLKNSRMAINYAAPPGSFPHISLVDLLRKKDDPDFMQRNFKDKIVMIGAYDLRIPDFHPTPYFASSIGKTHSMFGVEITANAIDTIIRDRYIRNTPVWINIAAVVIGCFIAILALSALNIWIGIPAVAVFMFIWATAAQYAFSRFSIRIDVAAVELALPLAFLIGHLHNTFILDRDKRFIQRVLGSYLDPRIVENLAEHGDASLLEGKRKEITVLFTDIRGFTTLSEKLEPEEIVEILNIHLSTLSGIIMKAEGMVDKYVGDAIMAIWNAPNDVPDHRRRACETAIKMQRAMADINREANEKGIRMNGELRIGIGINTGFAVVGNIGSEMKSDYTAIGDTVNVASRLEGLNKQFGTGIIISESTAEGVRETHETKELGAIPVKGRVEPVKIFELPT